MQLYTPEKNSNLTELRYLLLLLNATRLTFSLGIKLFELFPDITELLTATTATLTKLGLTTDEITQLKHPDWQIVEQDLRWAEQAQHHIITINDASYPALLKEIPNPPVVLFAIGELQLLKTVQLAMVGSRNPTPVGVETAFDFAKELVRVGLVVTSGLAIGIDAASHRGAMAGFGKTVAVMGTGLKHVYPSRHSKLTQEIVATGGVLLSEFPLVAAANSWHFPLRNRIISGLSVGTLVVEAALRSGSLITARLASEQGREVFAIPGSIHNVMARGCHYLIHQGAKLVEQPTDILEEFPSLIKLLQQQIAAPKSSGVATAPKNTLDYEHRKLLDCLGFEATTVDVLVARSGFSVAQVMTTLLELELQGRIKAVMGGYSRNVSKKCSSI